MFCEEQYDSCHAARTGETSKMTARMARRLESIGLILRDMIVCRGSRSTPPSLFVERVGLVVVGSGMSPCGSCIVLPAVNGECRNEGVGDQD